MRIPWTCFLFLINTQREQEHASKKVARLLWSRISNKLWVVQHPWQSCISRSFGHFHVFTVARLINCSVTNRAIKPENKTKLCQQKEAHLSKYFSSVTFLQWRSEKKTQNVDDDIYWICSHQHVYLVVILSKSFKLKKSHEICHHPFDLFQNAGKLVKASNIELS